VVGQRDALAAGPLVDEEAGLGGLAAAADVEGVDDVGEAGLKRTICRQSPAGVGAASWNGNTLPFCRAQLDGTVQVMRVAHHKLVRDQIPGIIAAAGGQPVTRVLDQADYQAALRAKLLEEAHEAQAAPDGQMASELADVLEVVKALAAAYDMSWEHIVSEASRKRAERGGFDNRTFLEYVDQAR
jgi:predicted house-cleaning noncanonical NTP pyrophosphatase (MazG superfamily)